MKRYFVKSLIRGWQEVPKEYFYRFIEHTKKGSVNVPQDKKDALIASRTKIIDE